MDLSDNGREKGLGGFLHKKGSAFQQKVSKVIFKYWVDIALIAISDVDDSRWNILSSLEFRQTSGPGLGDTFILYWEWLISVKGGFIQVKNKDTASGGGFVIVILLAKILSALLAVAKLCSIRHAPIKFFQILFQIFY